MASGSARSRLRLPPPFYVTLGKCLNLSGLQGMIPPPRLRDEQFFSRQVPWKSSLLPFLS